MVATIRIDDGWRWLRGFGRDDHHFPQIQADAYNRLLLEFFRDNGQGGYRE
jgi:hypothetical protein